jgi:plasmid stability protein
MTSISIKKVPDGLLGRLKQRASRNHRSLQGEALAILEAAVNAPRQLSIGEVYEEVRRLGLRTPSESTAIIRVDRSRHHRRGDRDDDRGR